MFSHVSQHPSAHMPLGAEPRMTGRRRKRSTWGGAWTPCLRRPYPICYSSSVKKDLNPDTKCLYWDTERLQRNSRHKVRMASHLLLQLLQEGEVRGLPRTQTLLVLVHSGIKTPEITEHHQPILALFFCILALLCATSNSPILRWSPCASPPPSHRWSCCWNMAQVPTRGKIIKKECIKSHRQLQGLHLWWIRVKTCGTVYLDSLHLVLFLLGLQRQLNE